MYSWYQAMYSSAHSKSKHQVRQIRQICQIRQIRRIRLIRYLVIAPETSVNSRIRNVTTVAYSQGSLYDTLFFCVGSPGLSQPHDTLKLLA